MKSSLLLLIFLLLFFFSKEQVTQIKANKSLVAITPLNNTIALFESVIDSSIWKSDGTAVGTIQISDTIKYIGYGAVLNGKFIFKGISPKCGKEIYITDGTAAGTKLVKDINPGIANSQPLATTMAILSNNVYFAAVTTGEGCELWKTDGTAANTTVVKNIIAGTSSGIDTSSFSLISTGTQLLFDGYTVANGNELWTSGGTAATTNLLKDINAGATSSSPRAFFPLASIFLFTITSADGLTMQIWRTNGTAGGTVLIKDNVISPYGFIGNFVFTLYHVYKNRAYFLINDNVHTGDALWSTDGTDATASHTSFIEELSTTLSGVGTFLIIDAINLSNKFIFPYSDGSTFFSLWQSDGTAPGTKSFKDFPVNPDGNIPYIYINGATNPLYNGKFFFTATDANGNELWTSDGTTSQLFKDINVGSNDGITDQSWLFTTSGLFFAANDGTHGNELWKTDGTTTTMVQDIFLNQHNADPTLYFVNNNKIFFSATDNNPSDSSVSDLFVVNGSFVALPVKLVDFFVSRKGNDALLQWTTSEELNTKDFTVQSSSDAQHWNNLGTVSAKGNSNEENKYSFLDIGIMNSVNQIEYYRLISNDFDGNSSASKIVTLRIGTLNKWNARLLVNPVNDKLQIKFDALKGPALISIHDLNGREVYKKTIQAIDVIISIPIDFQAGIYMLQIRSDNETKTLKFVKE